MKKLVFSVTFSAMVAFMALPAVAGDGGCKSKNCTCSGSCKDNKCTMECCTGKNDKSCKKNSKCSKECKKDGSNKDAKQGASSTTTGNGNDQK